MFSFQKNKILPKIIKIATYFVIIWIVFLLGRSLWQNYDLKVTIQKLNIQIATLEKEKKDLNNLIVYYKSDSFKELEARKKLGLKKPGEKMVILPASETPTPLPTNFSEEVKKEQESLSAPTPKESMPNWRIWWEYFVK